MLNWVVFLSAILLIVVGLSPFHQYYMAPGVVVPAEYHDLYAQMDAVVEECLVREDDRVEAGDVILRLEIPLLEDEIQRVSESLANLRATLEVKQKQIAVTEQLPLPKELWEIRSQVEQSEMETAYYKSQYKRALELSDSGVASEQEVEKAKLQFEQAEIQQERLKERFDLIQSGYSESLMGQIRAEANQIETQIRGMENRLQDLQRKHSRFSTLTAPGKGTILSLPARHKGQMVRQGALLVYMSLGDTREVRISGDERNLYRVRPGQIVQYIPELYDSMLFRQATGHVLKVSQVRRSSSVFAGMAENDNQRGAYHIYASIAEEPIPLKIGSQVNARVVLEERRIWRLVLGFDR